MLQTGQLIRHLALKPHREGGYYRRTFQADHRSGIESPDGVRYTLTSIYYLLTAASPTGHWHLNRSDILHYFHLGAPVDYYLIFPDGALQRARLGTDLAAGEQLQLAVPGGVWKASHLPAGDHGLISEAVSPGFDEADMQLGARDSLLARFPQHAELIRAFTPES
jgi:predicted cupin superfamily sugar epimerase